MIIIKSWPKKPNYISFSCPWCHEESMYMEEIVCSECNSILPDVDELLIDAKERLDFHEEASKGFLG